MRLADSLLLPLNCSDYAESLEQYLDEAVKAFEAKLANNGISMGERMTFTVPSTIIGILGKYEQK